MSFKLVPSDYIIFTGRKKLAILFSVFMSVFWLIAALVMGVSDSVILLMLFALFAVFFWYPYVRYGNLCLSTVKFSEEKIEFVDHKGSCWRSVFYKDIRIAKKTRIFGGFFGIKKDEVERNYICLYLKDRRDIPNVNYTKLFTHESFTMIAEQEALTDCLREYGIEVYTDFQSMEREYLH